MTAHTYNGLVAKQTWTGGELAEAEALINACNAYEDLHIKLAPALLRSRPANETNDFLYYADGLLVGLLALDDFPKEDREMTGVVHPEYRRRGIFTSLLNAALDEGRRRGFKRLVIVCERSSRSGMGFVNAAGAQYESSELLMFLQDFQPRDNFQPLLALTAATPDDIPDMARVIAASFHDNEERTRQHLADELNIPDVHYYIARLGSEPVSSLNVYDLDKTSAGIYAFGVMPEYRRCGFGRQVLERIISMIKIEHPERRIQLEADTTNTNAVALYRSCGFREVTTYGYYHLDVQ